MLAAVSIPDAAKDIYGLLMVWLEYIDVGAALLTLMINSPI